MAFLGLPRGLGACAVDDVRFVLFPTGPAAVSDGQLGGTEAPPLHSSWTVPEASAIGAPLRHRPSSLISLGAWGRVPGGRPVRPLSLSTCCGQRWPVEGEVSQPRRGAESTVVEAAAGLGSLTYRIATRNVCGVAVGIVGLGTSAGPSTTDAAPPPGGGGGPPPPFAGTATTSGGGKVAPPTMWIATPPPGGGGRGGGLKFGFGPDQEST